MTLLIVGDAEDLTSAYVRHRAQRRGMAVEVLDEDRFGLDWQFEVDGDDLQHGCIEFAGSAPLPLHAVAGAYVRFTPTPRVPAVLQDDPSATETYARERRAALHALLARMPAPVANPPGCGQANGSKPLQMAQLAAAGFEVPRWIAGNDADAVRAFAATCPLGAIVKSCSGTRSEVRKVSAEFIDRLAQGSSPVVVQAWVAGYDVRLHVVGDQGFATAVEAGPGVDYRFDDTRRAYRAHTAPAPLVRRCAAFARAQGLLIAGFDFRVTDDDRWACLECNPAPTFLPYEMETGQSIADALLDLMVA